MPASKAPPPSPTLHTSMQFTVCHYYEPQCPVTTSRSGFCDRHTAANAQAGLQSGISCPSDRGIQTWTQKESSAFLSSESWVPRGRWEVIGWFYACISFFLYLLISAFQVTGQQLGEPAKARPSDHRADSTFLQSSLCGPSPQGNQTCWLTTGNPVLGMLRQDFCESKTSLVTKWVLGHIRL